MLLGAIIVGLALISGFASGFWMRGRWDQWLRAGREAPAARGGAAAAQGQANKSPAIAAAILLAAAGSSSSTPAGRATSPISPALLPAAAGPSEIRKSYVRCRPDRLIELIAANPASEAPLTQQELLAMAQKFETKTAGRDADRPAFANAATCFADHAGHNS